MRSFFKVFFASLLALVVFSLIVFFLLAAVIGGLTSESKPVVADGSVLLLDLSQSFREQARENPLSAFSSDDDLDVPGLYDVLRLIKKAKEDKSIRGIFIKANNNANGFAGSEEIREALADFRESRKFVVAYGDRMTQRAYHVACVADDIFVHPQGDFQWSGFSVEYAFFKGTLDKLNIQAQVFYAGKFKSATEPFRLEKMSEENRLQTLTWLEELNGLFLSRVADARNLDTIQLRQWADSGLIRYPEDAVKRKLVDGLIHDDQVRDSVKARLGLGKYDKLELVTINKYYKAGGYKTFKGDRIALIYAEGDIVDGKGNDENIGGESYQQLIRKARLDKNIKAIVLRVNSGGGSTMASELIWREVQLAKKEKPVIVSFGDVAASGGYYISCAADSIFSSPMTLTGSIGVFSIIPGMEGFFKDKLGVSFDRVKTSPYADMPSVTRNMNETEKRLIQSEVEQIYRHFKERVADGRKKDTAYVETIAQGRVWSGGTAKKVGLIDRFGGIQDAVDAAASMAKLKEYRVKEYPEPSSWFNRMLGAAPQTGLEEKMKEELGATNWQLFVEWRKVNELTNTPQARIPFQFRFE